MRDGTEVRAMDPRPPTRGRMRVLLLHNSYQQRGGEDTVVDFECDLLRAGGHDVAVRIVSNEQIASLPDRVRTLLHASYDRSRADWAAELVMQHRADIVHVHNFFPLLTPAVHFGARRAGAAVVQTLHNYRLMCSAATFMRDGRVCEKCADGKRTWGVVHRCYRGSVAGSAAVAMMQREAMSPRWFDAVDRYIALTEFGRSRFVEGGIPAEKIAVKPNSVVHRPQQPANRADALFVGRLSREKGVEDLVAAWRALPQFTLTIAGDGPERDHLAAMAPPNVRFLGSVDTERVVQLMAGAAILVVPSLWYEGFPMTVAEAFSQGLPVAASRIGALQEIVREGKNGTLFTPGDTTEIAAAVGKILADADLQHRLSLGAREAYSALYSPARNLEVLEGVYRAALTERWPSTGGVRPGHSELALAPGADGGPSRAD